MPGSAQARPSIVFELPVAPAENGLVLRGQGYRTSIGLIGNGLFWMVMLLSALTVWMLLGTWRHMRRRLQMQAALVSETNFRRAMENSMLTGMRAMDMEGRISYVNPAFCAMTGFSETDLIGQHPPFPYWPHDRRDENARLLEQELQGKSPTGGIEVKVMRKDGSVFDARMYVSPLIDPKGQQTGWMTSMTNITEAKRIRDQLTASHERFTTVLEGLDTAVSVLSVQQGELLFANRSYRLWFGADAKATPCSRAATRRRSAHGRRRRRRRRPRRPADAGAHRRRLGFARGLRRAARQVVRRPRALPAMDRRPARADADRHRHHRAAQRRGARREPGREGAGDEPAGDDGRDGVLGRARAEPAADRDHQLLQRHGHAGRERRDRQGRPDRGAAEDLAPGRARRADHPSHPLVREAERAAAPEGSAQTIVEDAVDLAGIELRRRNVAIQTYVAQRLPPLMVDPILIEQVVLNLLKNAAEAIDNAHLPTPRRRIELRVVPRHSAEEGEVIEFTVTDKGPGLKDEVIARMYEAFFSTKVDGLGIGLSLCRSIIESHQGRIKAVNLYNGDTPTGCRFSFTLPVAATTLSASAAATA